MHCLAAQVAVNRRCCACWPGLKSQLRAQLPLMMLTLPMSHSAAACPSDTPSSRTRCTTDRFDFYAVHLWALDTDPGACPKAKENPRQLLLHSRIKHEALHAARQRLGTEEGWTLYARRASIKGTLSQAVRAFGLRRTRYRGLAKTSLQHVATAVAVNVERATAWLNVQPREKTRTSRFAWLTT